MVPRYFDNDIDNLIPFDFYFAIIFFTITFYYNINYCIIFRLPCRIMQQEWRLNTICICILLRYIEKKCTCTIYNVTWTRIILKYFREDDNIVCYQFVVKCFLLSV